MNNLTIRNAKLVFKNFAGKPTKFKPEGRRSFDVVIPGELAETLKRDGWNVKPFNSLNDDGTQDYHLPVAVFFGNYPPKIVQISGNNKLELNESTLNQLDYAIIKKCDLTISPSIYDVGGRKGVKAYLKTMYVTIEEDELDREYANIGENYFEEGNEPF